MRDLLLVCLGATAGLRAAEEELAGALERAGADVARVVAAPPREVRTLMATDLGWALAARRAAVEGIARHGPRAVVYSTTTAALLWPRPGAIRFDALAAATRPGRHGLWQRPLEARRLGEAPLLVPQAAGALEGVAVATPSVVVPVPVEPSGPLDGPREVAAVTYGANWRKKGLDRVLAAWAQVEAAGGGPSVAGNEPAPELVVAGADAARVAEAWAAGGGTGPLPASVRVAGALDPTAYRALLRSARVFVTAPRREDYGIAQLEALADGCTLVTTAAPGPYAALPLARALAPGLVLPADADVPALAQALRTALTPRRAPIHLDPSEADRHSPSAGGSEEPHAASAATLLAPFSRAAVDRVVAEELLPRLLRA